jgi:membrane-associated HD superfamily phosphohydrolase
MHDTASFIGASLGAGIGLAGLLLIFSGFLFAQAAIMPPDETSDKTLRAYRAVANLALVPFTCSLFLAMSAAYWFATPTAKPADWLSLLILRSFIGVTAITIIYGIVATRYL